MKSNLLQVLNWLHRDKDLYVVFGSKPRKEKLKNVGKIRIKDFQSLPDITASKLLSENQYFTPNSYHYLKPTTNEGDYEGLTWARYKTKTKRHLERINAVYVDLDIYNSEQSLSIEQVKKELPNLLREYDLPMYGAIAESGRGLYLYWRICGEKEPELGEKANLYNQNLHREVSKKLLEVFSRYQADSNAILTTQYFRIPNSIHSITGKKASYFINEESQAYTLKELASIVGVEVKASKHRAKKRTKHVPKRVNGSIARYNAILDDIEKIIKSLKVVVKKGRKRNNIKSRGRRNFLEIVAWGCKGAGRTKEETYFLIDKYYSKMCEPSYPSDETDISLVEIVDKAYNNKSRRYTWTSEGLAKHFGIKHQRAIALELRQICPESVKEERKEIKRIKRMELEKLREQKKHLMRGYLLTLDSRASLPLKTIHNNVNELLLRAELSPVSKELVRRECKALKVRLSQRGRPKKRIAELITLESYKKAS